MVVVLSRVHHMFSRIPNLRNLIFFHEIYRLFWSVLNGFSFRNRHANITCYFFSKPPTTFSQKKQHLEIENSGFVNTCDELIHNWWLFLHQLELAQCLCKRMKNLHVWLFLCWQCSGETSVKSKGTNLKNKLWQTYKLGMKPHMHWWKFIFFSISCHQVINNLLKGTVLTVNGTVNGAWFHRSMRHSFF